MEDDDDYEGSIEGLYENGHWVWDESVESLIFISDKPPVQIETIAISNKPLTGTIEFRDDADLLEQIRFRRRYQRKVKLGQPEVVTLQDLKDLALFMAPIQILSPTIIHILHLPTTERFLRALILCCQYYLQIADTMSNRMMELKQKIRTPQSQVVENEFRENLSDLRALVAKEYSTMLMGGADLRKFHHMGYTKKLISLSNKDARLMESLIRMFVQIVWLALGRKSFNQIELEINRLFKTELFNSIEHNLKTNYIEKMSDAEEDVLLGRCVRHDKKLTTRSPLINEMFCERFIDFRAFGLGLFKYEGLNARLCYFEAAISYPEEKLQTYNVVIGILGLQRSLFDTMLKPIVAVKVPKSTQSLAYSITSKSSGSIKTKYKQVFPDLTLPSKTEDFSTYANPEIFPVELEAIRGCSQIQRRRWENRYYRLLRCRLSSSS